MSGHCFTHHPYKGRKLTRQPTSTDQPWRGARAPPSWRPSLRRKTRQLAFGRAPPDRWGRWCPFVIIVWGEVKISPKKKQMIECGEYSVFFLCQNFFVQLFVPVVPILHVSTTTEIVEIQRCTGLQMVFHISHHFHVVFIWAKKNKTALLSIDILTTHFWLSESWRFRSCACSNSSRKLDEQSWQHWRYSRNGGDGNWTHDTRILYPVRIHGTGIVTNG